MIKYLILTEDILDGDGDVLFHKGYKYPIYEGKALNERGYKLDIYDITVSFMVHVEKLILH